VVDDHYESSISFKIHTHAMIIIVDWQCSVDIRWWLESRRQRDWWASSSSLASAAEAAPAAVPQSEPSVSNTNRSSIHVIQSLSISIPLYSSQPNVDLSTDRQKIFHLLPACRPAVLSFPPSPSSLPFTLHSPQIQGHLESAVSSSSGVRGRD